MNRRLEVRFPVFNYAMRVIFARDVERTGAKLGADLTGCAAAWVTRDDKPGAGWLVLPERPDEDTVAHEASHAVRSMLDFVGAGDDDEVFAYHLGHLVGRIHKTLKREGK